MFGSKKKKLEMKSVEEYVREESRSDPVNETITTPESDESRFGPKLKSYIPAAVAIIIIAAIVIMTFSKINALGTAVAELRTGINESAEVKGLKSQVSSLQAKLQASGRDTEQLRQQIVRLDRELDAAKAQMVRIEAMTKKPAPTPAPAKKKPAKPRT